MQQDAIGVTGWAIEARINCEDPAHGHRPEFGTVARYSEPALAGVRVDSGIESGSEIAPHYDSMIAKVIGYGATRAQAVERLRAGLGAFEAAGIGTNQSLLCAIADHSLFRAGKLTTGFLAEAFPEGWHGDPAEFRQAVCAAVLHTLVARAAPGPDYWQRQSGHRFMAAAGRRAAARMRVAFDGDEQPVSVERDGERWLVKTGDAVALDLQVRVLASDQLLLTPRHGVPRRYTLSADGTHLFVNHLGTRWRVQVVSEVEALARVAAQAGAQGSEVASEMPGAITEIRVAAGDQVSAGDVLVVMEAMKLIFPLVAPRDGTVAALRCAINEIVPRGQVLVQLEPLETAANVPAAAAEPIDK
jgi:3-methylcrotonyl-CoA carboxylase alpha subunit